ncbi:MAG: TraR/DksA family transcriptional regulator [Burkholderiales bacterium]
MVELTRVEIERLTTALDQRYRLLKEEVLAELEREGDSHYIELAGSVHDTADESMADLLSDLNADSVHRQMVEMRDIEGALQRVREGEYGACAECGAEIGFQRLRACPTASRCVACQTRQERMFASAGQSSL